MHNLTTIYQHYFVRDVNKAHEIGERKQVKIDFHFLSDVLIGG
jgi:hypothetical protein